MHAREFFKAAADGNGRIDFCCDVCELNFYWLFFGFLRDFGPFPAINRFRCRNTSGFHFGNCSILPAKKLFLPIVAVGRCLLCVCVFFISFFASAFIRNKSINVQWSHTKLSIIAYRRFGSGTLFRNASYLPQILPEKIIHNKYRTHVMPLLLCRCSHRSECTLFLLSFFLALLRWNKVSCIRTKSLRCVRAKTRNLFEIIQFRGDFTRFHWCDGLPNAAC